MEEGEEEEEETGATKPEEQPSAYATAPGGVGSVVPATLLSSPAGSLAGAGLTAGGTANVTAAAFAAPLKAADVAINAAAAAALTTAAAAARSGMPLLGLQSSTTSLPAPHGAGGNVVLGAVPAAACGLLGPSGMMGLLASIEPTRILVIHNALSDDDLANTAGACEEQNGEGWCMQRRGMCWGVRVGRWS
jgi:hypothetical protein